MYLFCIYIIYIQMYKNIIYIYIKISNIYKSKNIDVIKTREDISDNKSPFQPLTTVYNCKEPSPCAVDAAAFTMNLSIKMKRRAYELINHFS